MEFYNLATAAINLILSNPTESIALVALILAVWQGWVARKHNKLSVEPAIILYCEHVSDPKAEKWVMYLKNTGLGPAIVDEYIVGIFGKGFIRGELDESAWIELLRNSTGSKVKLLSFRAMQRGFLVGAGDIIELVSITFKKTNFDPSSEIVSALRYKTLYQERRYAGAGVRGRAVFMPIDFNDFLSFPRWFKRLVRDLREVRRLRAKSGLEP